MTKAKRHPELVGLAEAAEMVGVAKSTVLERRFPRAHRAGQLAPLRPFPEPVAELRCGPIWLKADVETYAEEARGKARFSSRGRRVLDGNVMSESSREAYEQLYGHRVRSRTARDGRRQRT
jgi:hypothetical protein